MTNYEKYRSEIEKFTCLGIGFGFNKETEEFDACYNVKCRGCMFFDVGNCIENKMKWAYSEYIEPEVDWSKVAVDTPILVSSDNKNWLKRYFAKYENKKIKNNGNKNGSHCSNSSSCGRGICRMRNRKKRERGNWGCSAKDT